MDETRVVHSKYEKTGESVNTVRFARRHALYMDLFTKRRCRSSIAPHYPTAKRLSGKNALIIASLFLALNFAFTQAKDNGAIPIGTEPPYFEVPNNHAAMQHAVIEARKTIGKFIG